MKSISLLFIIECGSLSGQLPATPETVYFRQFDYAAVTISNVPVTPRIGAGQILTRADDLQAALNSARGGDTITLQAGQTWTGNFILPVRQDQGIVTIQTSGTLPAIGNRVDPVRDGPQLATLLTPNQQPVVAAQGNTYGWMFRGIEFSAATTNTLVYDFITMGVASPRTGADMPSNLRFEQVWIHGLMDRDYKKNFVRGIWPGASSLTVTDSVINWIFSNFMESGCIAGDTAVGNIVITNNHLQCAGENVIFGANQVLPQGWVPDTILIQGNLIDKDMAWHDDPAASGIIVKNLTEFKNGKNITEDSNVLMWSFQRNQNGYSALFTPRTINCTMPWNNVSNVAFTNNIVRHAVGGLIWAKWDDNRGSCTTDQITPSVNATIRNNLFDDLSSRYAGNINDQTNVIAFSVFLNQRAFASSGLVIDRNTVTSGMYGQFNNNFVCPPLPPDAEVFTNNMIDAPAPVWANCTGLPDALPPTTVFFGNYFPQMKTPNQQQFVVDAWLKAYPDIATPKSTAGADLVKLAAIEAAVLVGRPLQSRPTADSVTPNAGSGANQSFTFKYSSINGYGYLSAVDALFSGGINGSNGCFPIYDKANSLYLYNDAVTALLGPLSPGAGGSLSNSQCTLNGTGSSVSGSGNTLTMTLNLSFSGSFRGLRTIFMYAADAAGLTSAWQSMGTWTTGAVLPPTVTSVAPINGSGTAQMFTVVYTDPEGTADLSAMYLLLNSTLNGAGACWVYYIRGNNSMYLFNDTGDGFISGSITPGGAGNLSNSQCTISSGGAVTLSGNDLTLPVAITFRQAFAGVQNVYGYVVGNDGAVSGWRNKGTWTTGAVLPPTVTSITPINGRGTTQVFTTVYTDPEGTADLSAMHLLFNSTLNGRGACWIYYIRGNNSMYLLNDTGNGFISGSVILGSTGSLSNSQCTISSGGAVTTTAGTLTLAVRIAFSSSFVGGKNVYGYVGGNDGAVSDWVIMGTWTAF